MVSKSEQQKLTSAHRPWKEGMNGWEAASGSKNVPFIYYILMHLLEQRHPAASAWDKVED